MKIPNPKLAAVLIIIAAFAALAPAQVISRPASQKQLDTPPHPRREIRFGVVGDYGFSGAAEADVAKFLLSSDLDFIITTGDNNYDLGDASTIDPNIGQYYHEFIYPYNGVFGNGATYNRFFPSLGNHDWYTAGAQPYLNFFTLPGNGRYYDYRIGAAHFFSIDSDPNEPDGVLSNSTQALWLKSALAASNAPFKIVYFHHAPYSSSEHGPNFWMQWPFKEWGASLVLSGHDHTYERLVVGDLPYIVCGLGGRSLYQFHDALYGSQIRYNADFGAMIVVANDDMMNLQFVNRMGVVIDECAIPRRFAHYTETPVAAAGSLWKYLDNGSNQGVAWRQPGFNDSTWNSGAAQLGYGDGDETTVVGYGPNPANKYITTYFRRSFNVANPSLFTHIGLKLLRDDGAVVYLNGSEIYRTNLPAGPVAFTTLATESVGDLQEFAIYGTVLPASLLLTGSNLLAVEVHQASPTSSDVSFDCELDGLSGDTTMISQGADWRFFDQGTAPAGDWKLPYYDASAWGSGPAQLGYGDGDEATVVSFGPDPNNKYITTYFRKTFEFNNPQAVRNLVMRTIRDDGIIVYLNGHEVYRNNLSQAEPGPATLAAAAITGADESKWTETWIDKRWLLPGRNAIAVEIHQASPQSSDISFDLELVEF
ncbi:MAG: metallophosphoesterase [Planctomycetes bacterium]|nr:metallophosphoesterase [Planctomycetota bacterium]